MTSWKDDRHPILASKSQKYNGNRSVADKFFAVRPEAVVFGQAGSVVPTTFIWAKNTFTLGRSVYQRQYEPILYGWRQESDVIGAARGIKAMFGP